MNARDSTGEKIEFLYHMVTSPYIDSARHFSIRITPDDQASVRNNREFNNVDDSGRRYTTLSGYPEPSVHLDHIGTLAKEQNRSTDVGKQEGALGVSTPKGMTEKQFISNLESAYGNYKGNMNYDLFPEKGTSGYNSNSFAVGLLQAAGGKAPDLPVSQMGRLDAPGYDKPVPKACFEKGNTC